MRHELTFLALFSGMVALALAATSAQAASDSTAPAKEGAAATEAPAAVESASEKTQSARHRRKAYLNSQRATRHEARKQAAAQQPAATPTSSAALADVAVSFKVDPRLTRSLYMGDRWFSAPTFTTTRDVNRVNVEVRAMGRDVRGQAAPIAPEWVSADPKIVTVAPDRGSQVTITVHRAGESSVRLVQPLGPGQQVIVKELAIRAWNEGSAIQAEITQKDATRSMPSKPGGSRQLSSFEATTATDRNLQTDASR